MLLNINDVREKFKLKGCQLLSNEYEGAKEKLKYICRCGKLRKMSLNKFQERGDNCVECKRIKEKQKTFTDLKGYYSEYDCTLIEQVSGSSFKFICSCGREGVSSLKHFKENHKCKKCCPKGKYNPQNKYSYSDVKNILNEYSCILITKKEFYKNASSLIKYKCKCGTVSECTFVHFLRIKHKCRNCYIMSSKLNFNDVYMFFKENGCELLEKKWISSTHPMNYICECGNKRKITWSSFKRGSRCEDCANKRRMESLHSEYVPTSYNQIHINELINGQLNYFYKIYSLDIAMIDDKIYIEYDGGGHNLSVKRGEKTQKDFENKELKRWYFLKNNGWREIRIISKKDRLPDDNIIIENIKYAINYIKSGHSWCEINIEDSKIRGSQFEKDIDLGKLRWVYQIKKDKLNENQ